MPTKRRKPNSPARAEDVVVTGPAPEEFTDETQSQALGLIEAVLAEDVDKAKQLVQSGAQCWVQDAGGWTVLHAAASIGDRKLCEYLLRKGNAVWNLVDQAGFAAGDIAWSLNEAETYDFLLQEGVRSEMIRAVLSGGEEDEEPMSNLDGEETAENGDEQASGGTTRKKSTASDNATFLASRLTFKQDSKGQQICVDAEGNGVMMGWEDGIMKRSAQVLCQGRGGQAEDDEFNVVNIGFGLGIIDEYLQASKPTNHIIVEAHPDVLAHAKSLGWYDKPGVRFYEGTWDQWLAARESGEEEFIFFDAVYFDTYSEHYHDLHRFLASLPDLLRSPLSRASFFHGLGATSRLFYDVYTEVVDLHLREIGITTQWEEVDVTEEATRWEGTEEGKVYWNSVVGPYRLPLCSIGI